MPKDSSKSGIVDLPPQGSAFNFSGGDEDQAFDMEAITKALLLEKMISLPKSVQRRVRALKNLHKNYLDVEKEYQKEIRALEFKYEKIFEPIFLKRSTIVGGEYEPTEDESKWENEAELVAAAAKAEAPKPTLEESAKGIPGYWHTVLQTNRGISEIIFPNDEDALKHLRDVRCTLLSGDQNGFELSFYFTENPYFSNSVLKKTYHLVDDAEYGQLVFDHATGTKIDWKAGKNLTVKLVTKKPKSKPKGKRGGPPPKPKVEEEPIDSFFTFFTPIEEPEDEESEEMVDGLMEADFDVGCEFKDKLIPQSILWFTGEAADFDDDFNEDDGDEFGDDDDDDGEDDEEDEDEEDDEPPKKGGHKGHSHAHGGGHSHAHQHPHAPPKQGGGRGAIDFGNAQPPPSQPECKQQ